MTKQEKQTMMAAVVQGWKASGLSKKAYARKHQIHGSSLRYWISKFEGASDNSPAFIELTSMVSAPIHLRYPNGVELTLSIDVPVAYIKSLIQFSH